MKGVKTVAEGVKTSKAARDLARKFNLKCRSSTKSIRSCTKARTHGALKDLMTRELKEE